MNTIARSALLLVAALAFVACAAPTASVDPTQPPVMIAEHEPKEAARLTLSASAAGRLGIETAAVTEQRVAGAARMVMPYAALIYDADGTTWAYTNPEELTYIRAQVTVERIDGSDAILTDGPPAGTKVVTVGGAELWGAEHGVGGGH